jgi:predicted transcriptional regulator
MTGAEPADFLSTMERRGALLRELAKGPLEKPALVERLDVSRSTVDRGLRELEERDLVTREEGGYRRTLPGRIALEEYDRFQRHIAGLRDGSRLLAGLDAAVPIDGALLAGARVVEASLASPDRPVEALYEVVDRAEAVRGFGPAIHGVQIETYQRRVLEEGMRADLVLTAQAIERLLADYGDVFERALDSDLVRFWQVDERFPYSVTVAETGDGTHVGVLVYGEEGIQGCILNDDPAAVEWGERRFEAVKARGEPVG